MIGYSIVENSDGQFVHDQGPLAGWPWIGLRNASKSLQYQYQEYNTLLSVLKEPRAGDNP